MPRIGFTAGSLLVPAGAVDVAQIAGVAPQMDDVDKLAVSLHGMFVVPGDTPIGANPIYDTLATHTGRQGSYGDASSDLETVQPHIAGGYGPRIGRGQVFNGTTWDRARNNWTTTVLASAARGASVNSDDQVNYDHPHLLLTVDITVRTAAETIQLAVELIDPISGAYNNVWTAAAAIGVVDTYTYLLGPAAVAAVYTENIHIVMPRDWRLDVTQVGVGPITYSVAVSYIHH